MRSSRTPRPARLAALGLETALGVGVDENWTRLLAGDRSAFSRRQDLVPGRELLVADVKRTLPRVPASLARYDCRNNALSLAALAPIEDTLREAVRAAGPTRVAVVMGTSTSGAGDTERALSARRTSGQLPAWFHYEQLEFGGAAGFVADLLGARGPVYAISTACSSGARALATARSLLALGLCDVVVAGATDTLCGLTTNGFASLQALSDTLPNPFSSHRSGLVLGEASAIFLVTRETHGIQLSGVGESCEAHHMSAPDPNGAGAEQAMRAAIADAGLAAGDIAYANLHGTGTPLNDAMESLAVARVLGLRTPVSSTKSMVGHALGAAGAVEAAFCWIVLDRAGAGGLQPIPHVYDGARDPALPALHFVEKPEPVAVGAVAHVLTNSFGFGGNNCTLVLSRALPC
jgi:3-oxoacyl-[acyl-carrier-protein] synthase-1